MMIKKRPKVDDVIFPGLCISTEIDYPYAKFLIDAPYMYSPTYSLKSISKVIVMNQVHFCLDASFSTYDSSIIKLTIHFQKIGTKEDLFPKCALLLIDLVIEEKERVVKKEEDIIKKIETPNVHWHLGDIPTSSIKSFNEMQIQLHFKFIQIFDISSIFHFSLHPPSMAPYFHFLNDQEISNFTIPLKFENQSIFVNPKILSLECAFFKTMFENSGLKLDSELNSTELNKFSDKTLVATVLHLYTGWLPGTAICEKIFCSLKLNSIDFEFNSGDWIELYETAAMLHLNALAAFATLQAKKCCNQHFEDVFKMVSQKNLKTT